MHNTAFQQKSVLEGFVQGCLCYQMKVVVAKTCDGGLKWETKCYILAVIHLCLVETCHHKKKKKKEAYSEIQDQTFLFKYYLKRMLGNTQ